MRLPIFFLAVAISFSACSVNNVTEDDSLKSLFDEMKLTGTFSIYDNGQGQFTIYNQTRYTDSAYTPASTFKIVNSLIGLETGVVKDDSAIINWNGTPSSRAECDKELPMIDAFHISCVNWYQELARRIGEKNMQHYLDTLGYAATKGRFQIKNDLDMFWLNNNAKVTADEQLGLVKKLYFDKLPFQKRTQQVVKKMMLMENNSNYKLSFKTGLGYTPSGNQLGWMVGWIEENNHAYFFVLQVETPDQAYNMKENRIALLKKILKKYGFMEGRK